MKLSSYALVFLFLFTTCILGNNNIFDYEKLIHVDEIQHLLDNNYVFIDDENQQSAIATYATVIDALQKLSPQELTPLSNYIAQLEASELDVPGEHELLMRKKLKSKVYCNLLVKQKLLANNLTVCNDTILNNLTVNGNFNFNSPNCLDVNCITTNNITANFITTQTIIANTIIGTFTGTIENAIFAEFFTQPLMGDVTGTQNATHVAFVCGVPACALAQTYSTVLAATSDDICGTLVLRDGNCNFSANLITATVTNALVSQTALFAISALSTVSAQFANVANFALTSSSALSALTSTSAIYFTGNLYGDVVGTQTATQVASVCGVPACALAQTFSTVLSVTSSNICGTLVLRDSNCNFSANLITATVTNALLSQTALFANSSLTSVSAQFANFALTSSFAVSALTSTSATYFTGNLYGDVVGTQTATLVAFVCGVPACALAQTYSTVLSATSSNICGTLVLRDSNCNFSANLITATVTNALLSQTALFAFSALTSVSAQFANFALTSSSAISALTSTSAIYFTGNLFGDVIGTQTATQVAFVCGIPACALAQTFSTVLSATSADIPNTLVLRDNTGSFAATTITLTGCLILTDSLNNIAGTVCANTNALIVAPQTTRALQTTANGNTRGTNAIDLQIVQNSTQVASGNYSGILSGTGNTASGAFAVVSGGFGNTASAAGSVVAGGGTDGTIFAGNTASGLASVVGGGIGNTASGNYSGILTGSGNTVSAPYAIIGGGLGNSVTGTGSVIGGGGNTGGGTVGNTVAAAAAFIGGGSSNTINAAATYAAIVGGSINTVSAPFAFIGAAGSSTISAGANYAVIGGGVGNTVSAPYGSILGGQANVVTGTGAVICGGGNSFPIVLGNSTAGAASFIGAGLGNVINSGGAYSAIVSGSVNMISAPFAFLGGGLTNIISAGSNYAVIGGGASNSISAPFAGILGGQANIVTGTGAVICGGGTDGTRFIGNSAAGAASFVGAGLGNMINSGGAYSAIVSGSVNTVSAPFSFIGGGATNNITVGGDHAVIGSGNNNTVSGSFSGILAGQNNIVTGTASVICGGGNDGVRIGGNSVAAPAAFIGAGLSNVINSGGAYSGIVSGSANTISAPFGFIGAGVTNTISAGANYAVIGAGQGNLASALFSAVLSGSGNTASGIGAVVCGGGFDGVNRGPNTAAGAASFIGGGLANSISAQSPYAAILSGTSNSITGASNYSVIAGGNTNSIQNAPNAFAAGSNVLITATGAFAWADASSGIFTVTLANSFNIRCSGGARIASNAAGSVGVSLAPNAGSWGSFSDVNFKTNIAQADILTTLTTLCTVTTYTWSYISQDPSIVHIGPMAQDLYNAFGYGEDPCYIGTSDAIGILAASVQALYQLYQGNVIHGPLMNIDFPITKKIIDERQVFIDELEERIKRLEDSVRAGAL